jgi:hypothetical protein
MKSKKLSVFAGVGCLRAVAQITLASIIHTVYKNGKYNVNGVLP